MSVGADLVAWCPPAWLTPDFQDFLEVLGAMFDQITEVADDEPDGTAGWSKIWDVDRCPGPDDPTGLNGLPWLAQFVGERLPEGISDAAARQWIRDAPNQIRATKNGIARAAQRHLTGSQTVLMKPRHKLDGTMNVDWLAMLTLASETPSPAVTRNDILSVMPADIQLDYTNTPVALWSDVAATYSTWADVAAANATWADVAQFIASSATGWLIWTN